MSRGTVTDHLDELHDQIETARHKLLVLHALASAMAQGDGSTEEWTPGTWSGIRDLLTDATDTLGIHGDVKNLKARVAIAEKAGSVQ